MEGLPGGATGGYPNAGAVSPQGAMVAVSPHMSSPSGGERSPESGSGSIKELRRLEKGVKTNVQTVENRIKFFRREEEKIWRDLEEVRRQAAKIEEGRARTLEKRLADQAIAQVKKQGYAENSIRAAKQREEAIAQRKQNEMESMQARRLAGESQRRESQEIIRRKRLEEAQMKLNKSERVVAIQREQLEAKLRTNQERADKLARIRDTQERERLSAEQDVQDVESKLPDLEQQEMACLQRLQNSRIVTQTVLQELEASLGSQSAVTSMLRNKQQRSSALLDPPSLEASPGGDAGDRAEGMWTG